MFTRRIIREIDPPNTQGGTPTDPPTQQGGENTGINSAEGQKDGEAEQPPAQPFVAPAHGSEEPPVVPVPAPPGPEPAPQPVPMASTPPVPAPGLTISRGDLLVRPNFNPTKNGFVHNIKTNIASTIDIVANLPGIPKNPAEVSEQARWKNLAITHLELAAMYAVKAATTEMIP